MSPFARLEDWMRLRCDGDWEHQGGIRIETTDNPGWVIEVDHDGRPHRWAETGASIDIARSETDYVRFAWAAADARLRILCGLGNLGEALTLFLDEEERAWQG